MNVEQAKELKKEFLNEWDKTFRWMPTDPEDIIDWVINKVKHYPTHIGTKTRYVTFGCSKSVHVFTEKCVVLPRSPYKSHESQEAAVEYLKQKGIEKPKIIIEK